MRKLKALVRVNVYVLGYKQAPKRVGIRVRVHVHVHVHVHVCLLINLPDSAIDAQLVALALASGSFNSKLMDRVASYCCCRCYFGQLLQT